MYKKSSTGWLKHLDFMVLDIICLQLAFVMGYFLRHHSFKPYGSPIYRNEAIVFALIQLMIMFFDDSFKNVMKRGYLVEIGMTVKNMVYIIVLGVFYLFLIQEGDQFSRATIMLTGALYGMLSYLMRIGWKAVVKKRSSGEHSGRSLLIITTEKQSQSVVKSMLDFDYIGVRPTGVVLVDQDRTGHKIHGVPVVSNLADAAEYVCREWFDEVLIVLPEGREIPQKVFDAFAEMGITIHVKIADVNEMQGKKSDCRAHGQLYRGHHLHQYGKRRTACAETNHGHLRRSCRMYSDRNHLPVRCPCDLYQVSGPDLLLTVPCRKERKKIQNLQVP